MIDKENEILDEMINELTNSPGMAKLVKDLNGEPPPGRAHTREMKKQITDELFQLWIQIPDMRLSQLIVNSFPPRKDLFYVEDYELVKKVKKFVVQFSQTGKEK